MNKAFKPKKAVAVKKKNTIATNRLKRNKASPQGKSSDDKLGDLDSSGNESVEVASDNEEKEQQLDIVEDEILETFNNASHTEFLNLSNVTKGRWELLIAKRPFENYDDLVISLTDFTNHSFLLKTYKYLCN